MTGPTANLPWTELNQDWFGKPVPNPPHYSLALSPTAITFHARRSSHPECNQTYAIGQFVEGLWEADVAEFFLCDPNSGRYLEVNLSPTGAFWWCLFDRYRERSKVQPAPDGIKTESTCNDQQWLARITIPTAKLPFSLSAKERPRFNVTFALCQPTRCYISATKLVNEKPDFHLVDQFRPIGEVVTYSEQR